MPPPARRMPPSYRADVERRPRPVRYRYISPYGRSLCRRPGLPRTSSWVARCLGRAALRRAVAGVRCRLTRHDRHLRCGMPVRPPSGTVTFLFTDIEDSTRLWDEAPADMADALRVHDAHRAGGDRTPRRVRVRHRRRRLLRRVLHGCDAAAAAVEAQEQLRDDTTIGFAVRMGLHTGEAIERDRQLLRERGEPRGAADVARARRAGARLGHRPRCCCATACRCGRSASTGSAGCAGRMSVYQVVADGLRTGVPGAPQRRALRGQPPAAAELARRPRAIGRRRSPSSCVDRPGHADRRRRGRQDPAGPRGRRRARRRVPRRRVDGRAGVGRRPGVGPRGASRRCSASRRRATRRSSTRSPRRSPAGGCCSSSTTASTCSTAAAVGDRDDPRPLGQRQGPRHLTRGPRCGRRDGARRRPAGGRRRRDVRRRHAVRRPGACRAARLRARRRGHGGGGDRDLRDARRAPAGHRAGGGPHGGHERGRGAGPARRPVPAAAGIDAGPRAPAHAAPRGRVVLRPADRRRARLCSAPRRCSPAASTWRAFCAVASMQPTTSTCSGISTRSSASRSSSPTTPRPAPATACSRPSASSPRTGWRRPASWRRPATATPRTSRARPVARWERWNGPGWRDAVDWVEAELGNLRAAYQWSAGRGEVEVATDIAAHAALMGFSVQLFETLGVGRGAARPRRPRPTCRASPACTPPPATPASPGGPRPPAANAHRATELEDDARYDPCEPGYATFVEALGQVYCGDLDRYVELTGEVARRYGSDRGYGLAVVRRRPPVGGPDRGGAGAHRGVGRRRPIARQPVLDRLRAVDRGDGVLARTNARRALAAWDEGVAFVREHRVQFFEGFLARDAARLHTSDGEPDAALGAVRRSDRRLPPRRQRAAADHHARQRARAVRTARPARAGGDAARRDVAGAVELPPRPRARRARGPARVAGSARARAGELIDGRRGARPRRRRRLRPRADRRSLAATPDRGHAGARPGGLSRREIEVLRLVADGRTAGEIATRAVHLAADRRAPHPEHLHEDRRVEPRRRHALGRDAPRRGRRPRQLTAGRVEPVPTVSRRPRRARPNRCGRPCCSLAGLDARSSS